MNGYLDFIFSGIRRETDSDLFPNVSDADLDPAPLPTGYNLCGNGNLDAGEECDCGLVCDELQAKCCNAATCTLTSNSTCSTGRCCDGTTCKVRQSAFARFVEGSTLAESTGRGGVGAEGVAEAEGITRSLVK